MRARFTSHVASMGFDYPAGREVEVHGKTYAPDQVPALVGQQWLASGVLELVAEAAALRSPETAARAAAQPRRAAAARN